jgi:adenylate kinase
MRLVLLGPPGSGKGTQGVALARQFGVRHLSTGDLLRQHIVDGDDIGRAASTFVERGELVPDDLIMEVAGRAVVDAATQGGYVLDGFPRTLSQAERAYELAKPADVTADAVVYYALADDTARERLRARAAIGRADDADDAVIERRLRVFHEQTEPLLDFYRGRGILVTVDAAPPPAEVRRATLDALRSFTTNPDDDVHD